MIELAAMLDADGRRAFEYAQWSQTMRNMTRVESKKLLFKLVLARTDIYAAKRTAELALEGKADPGTDTYLAFIDAIVIAYARPFSENRPLGPLPKAWRKSPDPRISKTHDLLITRRNRVVAHSNAEGRQVEIVPPAHVDPAKDLLAAGLGVSITTEYLAPDLLHDIHDTCMDLGRRLQEAIGDLLLRLYDKRVLPVKPFPLDFSDGL